MAEKRLIDSRELSRILKDYFKALISAGKDLVGINDLNADIHKIIDMMPSEEGIEWYDAEKGLPLVSDEYLVMIAYADKPTVLHYDADEQVFFCEIEDETVYYKVTHWAELPEGPNV